MRITRAEAVRFWSHPSQKADGPLPEWAAYYARDGVCLMVHPMPAHGVFMVHIGVFPQAWGRVTEPALALLNEIWADLKATRLVTWLPESNRHATALCRRLGAELDGRLPLAEPLACYGWSAKWV